VPASQPVVDAGGRVVQIIAAVVVQLAMYLLNRHDGGGGCT
jgi:hypothetical protein